MIILNYVIFWHKILFTLSSESRGIIVYKNKKIYFLYLGQRLEVLVWEKEPALMADKARCKNYVACPLRYFGQQKIFVM